MEEILSSIKRIIAEEGEEALQPLSQSAPRRARAEPAAAQVPQAIEEVLELTQEIVEDEPVAAAPKSPRVQREPAPAPASASAPAPASAAEASSILSVESEIAARQSLSTLSSMLVSPKDGEDNTLDGLVRSMLRPMLKEWLDARLPAMVEEMVAREIARITAGR